jgi:hypothetical protein
MCVRSREQALQRELHSSRHKQHGHSQQHQQQQQQRNNSSSSSSSETTAATAQAAYALVRLLQYAATAGYGCSNDADADNCEITTDFSL